MKPKFRSRLDRSVQVSGSIPAILLGALSFVCLDAARAADGTWTNTAGGNWNLAETTNWSGGVVADGTAFNGNFNTLNITADTTVALTEDRTIGSLTFGDTTTSSAAGWILGGSGKLTLAVSTGAPTITVNALGTGKNVTIGNIIDGTAGLTKAGTGSLSLGGVNTYTGTTTISDGTLALSSGNNRLPTSGYVLFSSAAGAATSRTLSLGSTTQEISRLNVTYNPNGGVTHTALVTGAAGSLKVSGTSDLNVTNSSSVTPASTPSVVHLDLSGLGTFEYNSPTKKVIILGNGNARTGTLSLGGTNTLTALALELQNGGAGGNTAKTSFLNLGQTNTINASTITILNDDTRDSATFKFRTGLATGPTLKIRGTGGTDSDRANINIATNTVTTNQSTGTGSIDLATGTTSSSLDAMVGTLQLGSRSSGTTTHSAAFSMSMGTLDATTINLGTLSTTGGLNSTFTVAGGTVKVSTLSFGVRSSTGPLTSTFNLNSAGTLAAQTVSNSGTATRTLNWNDGTISTYDSATDLAFASGVAIKLAATGTHAFDIAAGRSASVSSVLSDATTGGTLTKNGDGTLTLNAANTFTGNTVVNAGTFQLASGAQLKFVLGSASESSNSISGAGTVSIDGNFDIDRTAAVALSSGTWTLENVASLTGAYGSNFSVVGFTDAGSNLWTKTEGAKVWTFDETTGVLTLVTVALHLNWTGGVDGNWDIATTSNWLNGASSSTYAVGDHARFDDLATGTTNVVLNAVVSPVTVIFDNSSKNYTLTGTGEISGLGTLTKSGSGSVTIATTNSYFGGTTISAGTLQVGDGGTSGSLGTGAIANEGTLAFNRSDTLTLSAAISGAGNLVQSGSGTTVLAANNTFSGTTTINAGTLQIGNGAATGSLGSTSAIVNNGTLAFNRSGTQTQTLDISGSGSLVQQGPGTLILENDMTYIGATTINGGTLQLGNGGTIGSVASASITDNGNLSVKRSDDLDFARNISGSGSFTHAGSGTLRLVGTNTYLGNTVIAGTGTLLLDSSGSSIPAGSGIAFTGSGALDFSDTDLTISSLSKSAGVSASVFAAAGKTLTVSGSGNMLVNDGALSLSALDNFVYSNSSGTFSTAVVNSGGTATTTLASLTNTITASNFNVGLNGPSGSGTSSSATLNLGQATILNANTINVGTNGAQSGTSTLLLPSLYANPTVQIRGASGGSSRANLTVGYKTASDYAGGSGVVNLAATGSTLDAMIGTLTLGKHDSGAGNFNNATSGTFTFNAGTLDATSIVMAAAATVNIKTADGTLTTNGGTIKVGTLTMVQDSGGPMGTATVNLNSGATLSATTITGQAAGNALINWNEGSISNLPDSNLTATTVSLRIPNTSASRTLNTSPGFSASLASSTVLASLFNSSAVAPTIGGFTLSGTLNLNGAILSIADQAPIQVALASGTKLTLINYTGSTLSGTFAGIADGGTITVGANKFVVDYDDTLGGSGLFVTLTAANSTPFQDWIATFPSITDPADKLAAADPDKDGLPNAIEYVLGTSPASGVQSGLPVAAKGATDVTFTFTRLKAAASGGFTSTVEYSETLGSLTWTTATAGMTSITDNGTTETVVVTIPIPEGATRLFARMKVAIPSGS